MAKATEAIKKPKTKLDHFMEQYLVPKDDKTMRHEMRLRWQISDRNEFPQYYPTFSYEEVVDTKNGGKVTKVIDKRMNEDTLFELIKHDPTSILSEDAGKLKHVAKVGGYTQWLVNQYFKLFPADFTGYKDKRWVEVKELVHRFFEDLYKVKEDLTKFNRFKHSISEEKHDIFKVKDSEELYQLTKEFSLEEATQTKAEVKKRILRDDARLVYEDENYEIITPLTVLASHELAGPPLTRWCTASSSASSFHSNYTKQGPLYIIRDKNDIVKTGKGSGDPRPIYQFHFETGQYMDVDDRRIDVPAYLSAKGRDGMKEFFRPNFKKAFKVRDFDVNDATFKVYTQLYGTDKETTDMVLEIFKSKVEDHDEIVVQDENKDYSGFIDFFQHEVFLTHLLNFCKPTTRILEVTYKKYKGKGLDVPETLGKLINVNNMVLAGFVKSLPKSIANLKNLELSSFASNPHLTKLPEEMGTLASHLQVINIIESGLTSQTLPKPLQKSEENGKLLVVNG
jgi:hypothetical protein